MEGYELLLERFFVHFIFFSKSGYDNHHYGHCETTEVFCIRTFGCDSIHLRYFDRMRMGVCVTHQAEQMAVRLPVHVGPFNSI